MALPGSDSRWLCHLVEEWLMTDIVDGGMSDKPPLSDMDYWTVKQCSRCGKRPEKGDVFTSVTPLLQGTWHHNDCDDPHLSKARPGREKGQCK
jgi:hypothetical protein